MAAFFENVRESSDCQGDSKIRKHSLIDVIRPYKPLDSDNAFIFSLQASTALPFLL